LCRWLNPDPLTNTALGMYNSKRQDEAERETQGIHTYTALTDAHTRLDPEIIL